MLSKPKTKEQNTGSGFSFALAIAAATAVLMFCDQQCANSGTNKVDLKTHPQTALYLRQTSTLGHQIKATVTQRLFRLELGQPHCVLIADAEHPKTILMYSPDNKLFFREPPSKLSVVGFSLDARTLFKKIASTKNCTVAGATALQYTSYPNMEIESDTFIGTLSPSADNKPEKPKTYRITRADYFASTALDVPPQAIQTMSALVHAPPVNGVPLGLIVTRSDRKRVSIFYTSEISYVHVDKNTFICPPSYKLAKTDIECMFGRAKIGQLEDIFKDMEFGKDFGSAQKSHD